MSKIEDGYVLRYHRYWGIFWIDASTRDSIHRCLTQIALVLRVDQDVESIKRALANTPQTWLLVFDNADNPNIPLVPYFPAGDRGHIIITSRNPQCGQYSTVGSRQIGRMSLEDSETLLFKTVYGGTAPDNRFKREGQRVVEMLGCLALAIAQAGAYIRETSCPLDEYLGRYQQCQKEVLAYFPKHSGTDYRHTVYTAWQVALDMIRSMGEATSKPALELLRVLCFYHHDQIPVQMFYKAWHGSTEDARAVCSSIWSEARSNFLDYRRAVQASVMLLASFSLISQDSEASVSLHPLVHDWCREQMSAAEQQSGCRRAVSLLADSVEWRFKAEDYDFRRLLVSHVHACLRVYKDTDEEIDDKRIEVLDVMELILGENGWIQDAVQLVEQVVTLRKSKLGEDHPDTLSSLHNLANRYSETGRQDEALKLTEQVVALYKSKLGEDHPDTLSSLDSLAIQYSETGRQDEALKLTEQVITLRKGKLGENHPDTLSSMHNLANLYSKTGRQDEALKLSEQVVTLRKSKLGENHPDTLESIKLLAYISETTDKDLQRPKAPRHKRDHLHQFWQRIRL